MKTINELDYEIKELMSRVDRLKSEIDELRSDNATLQSYYSEKQELVCDIKELESRLSELDKFIELEEYGIDTKRELEKLKECNDCESYKYMGYDSCKDCSINYPNLLGDLIETMEKEKQIRDGGTPF